MRLSAVSWPLLTSHELQEAVELVLKQSDAASARALVDEARRRWSERAAWTDGCSCHPGVGVPRNGDRSFGCLDSDCRWLCGPSSWSVDWWCRRCVRGHFAQSPTPSPNCPRIFNSPTLQPGCAPAFRHAKSAAIQAPSTFSTKGFEHRRWLQHSRVKHPRFQQGMV